MLQRAWTLLLDTPHGSLPHTPIPPLISSGRPLSQVSTTVVAVATMNRCHIAQAAVSPRHDPTPSHVNAGVSYRRRTGLWTVKASWAEGQGVAGGVSGDMSVGCW